MGKKRQQEEIHISKKNSGNFEDVAMETNNNNKTLVGWNIVDQFPICLMIYVIVHPNLGIMNL